MKDNQENTNAFMELKRTIKYFKSVNMKRFDYEKFVANCTFGASGLLRTNKKTCLKAVKLYKECRLTKDMEKAAKLRQEIIDELSKKLEKYRSKAIKNEKDESSRAWLKQQ